MVRTRKLVLPVTLMVVSLMLFFTSVASADPPADAAAGQRTWQAKLGYLLARSAFRAVRDKMDPARSNGGVFLGLNGVVIKSHGGADAGGFASAVDIGYDMVRYDLLDKIHSSMARDRDAMMNAQVAGAAS